MIYIFFGKGSKRRRRKNGEGKKLTGISHCHKVYYLNIENPGERVLAAIFSPDSIQRLRDALDIVSVVESYLPLKRAGARYKALCPFHNEKTPSFTVSPELQLYKCFGCNEGGDVFTFVMKMDGLSFPEAVEMLAERAGVPLERTGGQNSGRAREEGREKKRLYEVLSRACEYFETRLEEAPEARAYLLSRGFEEKTIRDWRLGWAPARSSGLMDELLRASGKEKEAVRAAALAAGLVRQGERELYDFFRERVMFPILDIQHRPIAFGGRVLKEEANARVGKYVNSPETALFSKGRVLFGLDAAAKEIRLGGTAVVVEGYTDVIMCHQHGLRNVVATLGTALTREHARLLRRYAETVVACFDADAAGDQATARAVRVFMEEDTPLRVARSRTLKDACEFLPRHGAEAFRAEIDSAEDSFDYMKRLWVPGLASQNIDERDRAIREIMEVVNLSPNPIKRAAMRKKVSEISKVSEDLLPGRDRPANSINNNKDVGLPAKERISEEIKLEQKLLAYMLRNRAWCEKVSRVKGPEEFGTDLHRELASEIHDAWAEADPAGPARLLQHVQNPEAGELLSAIAMAEGPPLSEESLAELLNRVRVLGLEGERFDLIQKIRVNQETGNRQNMDDLERRAVQLGREIEELKKQGSAVSFDGSAS
ncbi:MAG: DNA primase [Planctomycetota bacterium]